MASAGSGPVLLILALILYLTVPRMTGVSTRVGGWGARGRPRWPAAIEDDE